MLAPLHGSDWDAPALGDFYFQAFDGSVSLPVAGYNYNSGWISFCWRDLHPLEWQLASLHDQRETWGWSYWHHHAVKRAQRALDKLEPHARRMERVYQSTVGF